MTVKKKAKKKVAKKKPAKPKKKVSKLEQLVSACKLWDKVTTKANDGDYAIPSAIQRYRGTIYAHGDYQELQCRIIGDKAELTVGSSAGHKARADLDKKTFDYYDPRRYNNSVIEKLLKAIPLSCKTDDSGVHCKGLTTQAKINGAFKVMAMPTSMDFRQSHCEGHHFKEDCRKAEIQFFNSGPKHTK